MNIDYSDHVKNLHEKILAFMDEHIYPSEAIHAEQVKEGDRWCLCAPRWHEALVNGHAPHVILEATHEGALQHCQLDDLITHASIP